MLPDTSSIRVLAVAVLLLLLCSSVVNGQQQRLRVAYEWRQIDFAYPSAELRAQAIADGSFVPANVIPVGVERAGDRLFVTLPRWKRGVPASLAYVDMNNGEWWYECVYGFARYPPAQLRLACARM